MSQPDFPFSFFWEQNAPDYWHTRAGILDRLGMLANEVEFGTFNGTVKVASTAYGVTDFKISGPLDAKTCDYCAPYVGEIYHRGQFMPELPAHPNCRHYYEPIREGAPPDIFAMMQQTEQPKPPVDIFALLSGSGA